MSDLPDFHRTRRHWLEYVSTAGAVIVSVVSLWVAIGTEDANRKMVAASSWPFLQVTSGNSDAQNHPVITFSVTNAGVGPAKVKSFEVFWKDKPYHTSFDLMHSCCGYELPKADISSVTTGEVPPGQVSSAHIAKIVIRAGEERAFLSFALDAENRTVWKLFDNARQRDIRFRICYCSVFDECWIDTYEFEGEQGQRQVNSCPVPKVGYVE